MRDAFRNGWLIVETNSQAPVIARTPKVFCKTFGVRVFCPVLQETGFLELSYEFPGLVSFQFHYFSSLLVGVV